MVTPIIIEKLRNKRVCHNTQYKHITPATAICGRGNVFKRVFLSAPMSLLSVGQSTLNIYDSVTSIDDLRDAAKKSRLVALNILPIPK